MIYTAQQVQEFKQSLSPNKSLLGVDYGSKRTGLAVSDIRLSIATSLHIVEGKNIFREFEQLSKTREIGGVVVGLPLQMDGTEGEMATLVREFATKISESFGVPVLLWDERMSSRAVENFFIKEADLSRKKRKDKIDSSAAAYILQGALDRLSYL